MKKEPVDQLRLTLPEREEAKAPRPKRRRFVAPPQTDRRARPRKREGPALLQPPVLACCGFCGARLTVHADAAVCPSCGGIVARPEPEE